MQIAIAKWKNLILTKMFLERLITIWLTNQDTCQYIYANSMFITLFQLKCRQLKLNLSKTICKTVSNYIINTLIKIRHHCSETVAIGITTRATLIWQAKDISRWTFLSSCTVWLDWRIALLPHILANHNFLLLLNKDNVDKNILHAHL